MEIMAFTKKAERQSGSRTNKIYGSAICIYNIYTPTAHENVLNMLEKTRKFKNRVVLAERKKEKKTIFNGRHSKPCCRKAQKTLHGE